MSRRLKRTQAQLEKTSGERPGAAPAQGSFPGGFLEKDTGVEEAGAKAHRLEQTWFRSKPT